MISALWIALLCLGGYLAAYHVYGRYLRVKILELDPSRATPARRLEDGVDFVPTRRWVLFGHHFTSIAGLGPIVGPAVAVMWGWLPALLWVFFGTILIGGVHDLASLAVSLRHEGRSIGDLTDDLVGPRARLLFLVIIFFLLALAMGVFALIIAVLFVQLHPEAIIPVFGLMLIASLIGVLVYRVKLALGPVTLLGLGLMFGSIWLGLRHPVVIYPRFLDARARAQVARAEQPGVAGQVVVTDPGDSGLARGALLSPADARQKLARAVEAGRQPLIGVRVVATRPGAVAAYLAATGDAAAAAQVKAAGARAQDAWTWVLLAYAYLASVLPVWLLLQPRDYLNSFKLYIGLVLMLGGLLVLGPPIVAPAFNAAAHARLPIFPYLFITIACGAISGFHSLVSSGTTARQLETEADAQFVGYGGMLAEGMLAVLVVLACTAGLGSAAMWHHRYTHQMNTIGQKLAAFIDGAGYLSTGVGLPAAFGAAFMAVMVVAFAMTTLDSATRLLRYNVEELARSLGLKPLANRYVASLIAVVAIGYFAFFRLGGKPAGIALWQLFGSTNQLLAGLSLLVIAVYLVKRGTSVATVLLPMVFMFAVTLTAMGYTIAATIDTLQAGHDSGLVTLLAVSIGIVVLTLWLVGEAIVAWRRHLHARATAG